MAARARASSGWLAFAWFALAYAALALLGRSTVVQPDGPTSLVWPAAGVAALWLLSETTLRGTLRGAAGIAVVQAVVMLGTGSSPFFGLVTVVACVAQAWIVVALVRRWCPTLLGAGGAQSVHDPVILLRGTLCAVAATLVAALVGGVGLALEVGTWEWWAFVTWFGRMFAGLMVVGATGHLLWEHWRSGRRLGLGPERRGELALMVVLLVVVLVLGYQQHLPLAFVVVGLCVWTALRFETFIGAAYTTVAGAGVARLAFHGHSLFETTISREGQALITQGFVLTALFTSLIIGTIRDERATVIAQLEASERELASRGLLLDSMTEAMTEGIAVVDADGRIIRVNAAARRLIGATDSDDHDHAGSIPLRRPDGRVLGPDEHPSMRAIATGEVVVEDVVVPLADGTRRILAVTAAPISRPGPDGLSAGAVAVYRDVTEERRHVELLDAMTESMTEGLIVVDADGTVIQRNSAAERLLGQTDTGLVDNIHDYPFFREDGTPLPPDEHPSVRARAEGRAVTQDMVIRLAGGRLRTLSVTAAPLTGGLEGFGDSVLKVYRDVTDERRTSGMLADFASTAAHDLRSPLTSLRGWIDLAAARLESTSDATRALTRARDSVDRMQSLIADLLDQALAEGGQLQPEVILLGGPDGLVRDVALDVAEDADIVVDDDLPAVLADPDLVRQLLRNLIGNAVKYVDDDRAPHVVVTSRTRGDRVVVDVTDNGIGIPPGARALVFERFHRAHATDPRFTGTGLGLAICRTIVERHGGRIVALPAPGGQGTTFRFDLPRAPGADVDAGPAVAATGETPAAAPL